MISCTQQTVNRSALRCGATATLIFQHVLLPRRSLTALLRRNTTCSVSEMFSFLKRMVSAVLPWGSAQPPDEVYEEALLTNISSIQFGENKTQVNVRIFEPPKPLGQSDPVHFDVETFKFVHRTGTVTYLSSEFGLIDQNVYFEPGQVEADLTLNLHDKVLYTAYRAKENEAERLYRVCALINGPSEAEAPQKSEEKSELPKPQEVSAIRRIISGRVTSRNKKEVFVDSVKMWFNLDKIKISFIPVEGDWVELEATVLIDEEAENLTGEILDIISLRPLLQKSGCGIVTYWSESDKQGIIENIIYFTSHCFVDQDFIPILGNKVMYDAVESEQGKYRWRATKVIQDPAQPINDQIRKKCNRPIKNNLLCDKNGISIKPHQCNVEVELNQVKTVRLEVTNSGEDSQLLVRTNFLRGKNCQMRLVNPLKDHLSIDPDQTVVFEFRCEGKFLGLVAEMCFFYFKNFVIARRFEVNVTGNKEMNKLLECKFGTVVKVLQGKTVPEVQATNNKRLFGPKPWAAQKFTVKEMKCHFNIPKKLLSIPIGDKQAVLGYAPYFKQGLKFNHYADWFHTLLYLEEIDIRLNFKKYSMKEVYLRRCDDFLVLEVPGLMEKRPSLTFGDKVIASRSWSEGKEVTSQVGFVHDIREKEVYVRFHNSFHESYDETECDITFEPNISFFLKAHQAVNRAVQKLGEKWLFPSVIEAKPPLIDFVVSEQDNPISDSVAAFFQQIPNAQEKKRIPASPSVAEVESTMSGRPKKTLKWASKMLNERQKLAVVNILKGEGRPLPYIIFGPPGTGKTVTLVEVVVQIYRMMPDSRILISTPSNSSADLLCERLIDLANLKPGEMVRLMALYRVHEGLVPPRLIPYTACQTEYKCPMKNCWEKCCRNLIQKHSINELLGRHRITVATCASLGTLHYKGLPPNNFTHILVDEAGQTSEPEILITATFQDPNNGQVVLAGDPQQLGPVICSSVAKSFGLGDSLLQRLISRFPYTRDCRSFDQTSGFDPRFITKLNVNYRTVPEILSLPSQMFYNSDLIPTVSQTDGKEAAIIKKFDFKNDARDTPAAIIFHGIVGQNYQEKDSPSWFNPHEIWLIISYLGKLYSHGLKSSDVGIVTPYSKQVRKLRTLLVTLGMSVPKIGSVEEFQGQERMVIIVSTVRSSPQLVVSDVYHSLGFVASPQRLNVALTRARALLILIGNPVLLSRDPYWKNVVKYCKENKSYMGCDVDALMGDVQDEAELE